MVTYARDLTEASVAKVDLAAADSSKTLVPAPREGVGVKIHRLTYISKTSAAQAMNVAAGSTNVMNLAASITAHTTIDPGPFDPPLRMPAATAVVATPAAAGPAGTFYITYSTE